MLWQEFNSFRAIKLLFVAVATEQPVYWKEEIFKRKGCGEETELKVYGFETKYRLVKVCES